MDGPIITIVGAYNIRSTGAFISWATDTPAQSKVDYGTSLSYGNNQTNSTLKTKHGLQITGLTNNTTYNYKITATDAAGKVVASANATFVTRATVYKPGDANGDNAIDALELSLWSTNYNQIAKTLAQGNVDRDPAGLVDDMDLNVIIRNFGL